MSEEEIQIAFKTSAKADDGIFGIDLYITQKRSDQEISNRVKDMLKRCKNWLEKFGEERTLENRDLKSYSSPNGEQIANTNPGLKNKVEKIYEKEKRKEYIDLLEEMINENLSAEEAETQGKELKKELLTLASDTTGNSLSQLEKETIDFFHSN